jgi:methyl-accepting chemotaxis protein
MRWMRAYSIRTRMLGAIAVVITLLLAVGAAGGWGLARIDGAGQRFVDQTYRDLETLSALSVATANLRRFEKDMVIAYENPAKVEEHFARWQAAMTAAREAAAKLAQAQNDEGTRHAGQLQQLLDEYGREAMNVVTRLRAQAYDSASVVDSRLEAAKAPVREAERLVGVIHEHLNKEAELSQAERAAAFQLALALFAGAVVLAVVIVVPTTLLNLRSITQPLGEARRLAEAIAEGDLSHDIRDEGRDEAAALVKSLTHMQRQLRQIVGSLHHASDSIRTASTEIASGNADLSARTEQTASNLQQAASSMEQLTGTVAHSADAAAQANQLASSAAQVARRGGEVVGQVVSTMDEINASSKKIADIIGVIDGIAFQTNILALNAAVEAARAGEQGRGFAVVAGEVRSLAQRSAEAAKEIKALIGTSVDKVETGSKLVADAGATMNEIVASVQRVSDIIGEISAAAREQSSGLGQVNAAVADLDRMTQQNAALVEQSAAAAESLKEQAKRLADVVATFRLGATAPAAPTVAKAPAPAARQPASKAAPSFVPKASAPALKPETPKTMASSNAPRTAAAADTPAAKPTPVAATADTDDDWQTF